MKKKCLHKLMNIVRNATLKISSILGVLFDNYPKDFTFFVNGETFHTNKIIADLLSKKKYEDFTQVIQ